mmetsp:Transcript_31012/g.90115  ORF Transcript_31012/g.90115 Transcript_31012/m.90115 type:complete len:259 (-) Transcript_31012:557-1333(-)
MDVGALCRCILRPCALCFCVSVCASGTGSAPFSFQGQSDSLALRLRAVPVRECFGVEIESERLPHRHGLWQFLELWKVRRYLDDDGSDIQRATKFNDDDDADVLITFPSILLVEGSSPYTVYCLLLSTSIIDYSYSSLHLETLLSGYARFAGALCHEGFDAVGSSGGILKGRVQARGGLVGRERFSKLASILQDDAKIEVAVHILGLDLKDLAVLAGGLVQHVHVVVGVGKIVVGVGAGRVDAGGLLVVGHGSLNVFQ